MSALAGCSSLHTLDLSHTGVTDVSALAGCSSLHTLDLSCTEVTDVSALAGWVVAPHVPSLCLFGCLCLFVLGLFHFGPCGSLFFFCFFVVFAGVSETESR